MAHKKSAEHKQLTITIRNVGTVLEKCLRCARSTYRCEEGEVTTDLMSDSDHARLRDATMRDTSSDEMSM